MCSSVLSGGSPERSPVSAIDASFHKQYQAAYEELAGRGERVLACAMLALDKRAFPESFDFNEDNFPQSGKENTLRFAGEGRCTQ